MNSIRTIVCDGRVDVRVPDNLPDGTAVEVQIIPLAPQSKIGDGEWDDRPEGIEAWIKSVDALEPLVITPEEQAEWDAAKAERKQWEKDHFFERADKLAKEWK